MRIYRWLSMTCSGSLDFQISWRYVCQCVSWREDAGVNAYAPSECARHKTHRYWATDASAECRCSKARGSDFAASCASELRGRT